MIQVRRTQPNDLEYILSSSAELGFKPETMIDHLSDMMVVIDNNKISGIGFFKKHGNECALNWIYISENRRREKLGTMLVKTMLSNAEQQGAAEAFIHTSCNEFAISLGFKKVNATQQEEVYKLYDILFKEQISLDIYKVSLLDYFRPCCHK